MKLAVARRHKRPSTLAELGETSGAGTSHAPLEKVTERGSGSRGSEARVILQRRLDRGDGVVSTGSGFQDAVFFLPNFEGGGAERVMITLANSFSAEGRTVRMVVMYDHGPLRRSVSPNVAIETLHCRSRGAILALAEYCRKVRPSVILAAYDHFCAVPLLAAVLARTGARVIATVHTVMGAAGDTGMSTVVRRVAMASSFRLADRFVTVSEGSATALAAWLGLPRSAIDVLPNPVITPEFVSEAQAGAGHPWLDTPSYPVIVACGRLGPVKRFDHLVRAFALVRREVHSRLVIIGEGPERARLTGLISALGLEDDVSLPGFVPNPGSFMLRANAVALSSVVEGLPSVLIEALALGRPVVSTDCPSGPAEVLEHGRWGRLVPPHDVEALAGALVAGLSESRAPAGAREAMHERFGRSAAVDAYRRILFP